MLCKYCEILCTSFYTSIYRAYEIKRDISRIMNYNNVWMTSDEKVYPFLKFIQKKIINYAWVWVVSKVLIDSFGLVFLKNSFEK